MCTCAGPAFWLAAVYHVSYNFTTEKCVSDKGFVSPVLRVITNYNVHTYPYNVHSNRMRRPCSRCSNPEVSTTFAPTAVIPIFQVLSPRNSILISSGSFYTFRESKKLIPTCCKRELGHPAFFKTSSPQTPVSAHF